nr:MAG TPA: hypothetical protein [Caudoviricetes sp.]DAM81747.1 MAG TPA: hypothetical protein [Caudoviricetes sp.]
MLILSTSYCSINLVSRVNITPRKAHKNVG